jgi:hypothetical protein
MTYTMKHAEWQWLIEPEPQGTRCILKFRKPTEWTEARRFDTPEAAAAAVANGTTGEKEWDDIKRDAPLPGLAAWLIDPSAGPLSIVGEVLKATLLPPRAEPRKAP